MALQVGIIKETQANEQRVALTPTLTSLFSKLGLTVLMEKSAGMAASLPDSTYTDVTWITHSIQIWKNADIILKVQPPTLEEIQHCKPGCVLVGLLAPYTHLMEIEVLQQRNVTSFAMEFIPRISRAQSMDALSSQAAVSGYKAVLKAAMLSGKFFPMLTTAAGTIRPTTVLVIGAGVAGLQAIATARRLGANVEGYDIRPTTKEQVESLGAKFVDISIDAASQGGYARTLTTEEKQQQANILAQHVAKADVVICTAAIPGHPAPLIVTKSMVNMMTPGAVLVDLAAEFGGNCELTQPGQTIRYQAITIDGPINMPSSMPISASEMYSRNLLNFVKLWLQEGELAFDWQDPIINASIITHQGEVKNEEINRLLKNRINP